MNIKAILILAVFCILPNMTACYFQKDKLHATPETFEVPVERIDTLNMIILYPKYSRVDLVCGTMPSKQDSSVILMVGGSYTGEKQNTFNHKNIAGDHVSSGKRYKGYKCKRNTGGFVFYNGESHFIHEKDYSNALDEATKHGGAGFAQELIIHKGKIERTTRKDDNFNTFRALCTINERLCVVQSQRNMKFGDFKASLIKLDL